MSDFGDTEVFRKYNVGLLKTIVKRLDRLIELFEDGMQIELTGLTEEDIVFEEAEKEFGTTD